MVVKKNKKMHRKTFNAIRVELIPAFEDDLNFQIRIKEVQVLLTNMFVRLNKRGRPKKDEGDEVYAA